MPIITLAAQPVTAALLKERKEWLNKFVKEANLKFNKRPIESDDNVVTYVLKTGQYNLTKINISAALDLEGLTAKMKYKGYNIGDGKATYHTWKREEYEGTPEELGQPQNIICDSTWGVVHIQF
jgi:hypothetical protein